MQITNLAKYKASWRNWWQGLQPKWRLLDDGTFSQEAPNTINEWEGLLQGGHNGFFVIIVAFSWWVKEGELDMELKEVLDDITWVVRCMADMPVLPDQLIGGKHAQEDEPDSSIKKKSVRSFSISSQANGKNVRRKMT
jgi:hypothetical protein